MYCNLAAPQPVSPFNASLSGLRKPTLGGAGTNPLSGATQARTVQIQLLRSLYLATVSAQRSPFIEQLLVRIVKDSATFQLGAEA